MKRQVLPYFSIFCFYNSVGDHMTKTIWFSGRSEVLANMCIIEDIYGVRIIHNYIYIHIVSVWKWRYAFRMVVSVGTMMINHQIWGYPWVSYFGTNHWAHPSTCRDGCESKCNGWIRAQNHRGTIQFWILAQSHTYLYRIIYILLPY